MTSAKSNTGHLEACAGSNGLCKCILMVSSSIGFANSHLKEMNPHLDVNGFPQLFETEMISTNLQSSISGVSSFGFGGTNSRADCYGRCRFGKHSTEQFMSPMRVER